jgi:hypothetical protein
MFHELLTGLRAATSSKLKMVHDYDAGTNHNPELNSVPSYKVKSPTFQLLQQAARLQKQTQLEFSSLQPIFLGSIIFEGWVIFKFVCVDLFLHP